MRRQQELSTPQLPKKTRKRGSTNKVENVKTLKVGKVEETTKSSSETSISSGKKIPGRPKKTEKVEELAKSSSEASVNSEKKKRGRPRKNEKVEIRQVAAKKPKEETKKPRPRGRQQKVKNEEVHDDHTLKVQKPTTALPSRRFGAAKFTDDFLNKRNIKSKNRLYCNHLIIFVEQNELFDSLDDPPTIKLNKKPRSELNVGGSEIFTYPDSMVSHQPSKVSKKPKSKLKGNWILIRINHSSQAG